MDFDPTPEQEMMKDAIRRLTADQLQPILDREPANKPLSKAAMTEIYGLLSEFGLSTPRLPEELGGPGMSMIDYGLMLEELPAAIALSLVSHDGSTVRLATGAPEAIRETYVPSLVAGKSIICTATSEPEAGSNSNAIRSSLTYEGDDVRIKGRKMWITNASVADLFIVTCTSGNDEKGRQINHRVLVERDRPGVSVSEIPLTGLRQGHLSEVNFDDVVVPKSHVIGEPGDAGKLMTLVWNGNRPFLGLIALSLASKALEMTKEHCANRKQFGRPLHAMQLVQQDLSQMETLITSGRLLALAALGDMDKGRRSNGISAMAKRLATDNAVKAIDLAMQLHGALGITEELGLEQMWRDARIFQVPDGTMGILSMIHAREMTGASAF